MNKKTFYFFTGTGAALQGIQLGLLGYSMYLYQKVEDHEPSSHDNSNNNLGGAEFPQFASVIAGTLGLCSNLNAMVLKHSSDNTKNFLAHLVLGVLWATSSLTCFIKLSLLNHLLEPSTTPEDANKHEKAGDYIDEAEIALCIAIGAYLLDYIARPTVRAVYGRFFPPREDAADQRNSHDSERDQLLNSARVSPSGSTVYGTNSQPPI